MAAIYKGQVVIWIKPKYSKLGVKEIVGSYYHPYGNTAKEIITFWISDKKDYKKVYVTKF